MTLQTEPGGTSVFLAFGGDCALATCQTAMESPRTVTATFVPNFLSVIANAASLGSGRIVSTPAGIDCTLNGPAAGTGACSASFAVGTVVSLSQEPLAGAIFQAWGTGCTGNPCSITMNGQRTIDATYRMPLPPGTLTVSGAGTGSGVISSAPDGITCTVTAGVTSGTCSASFPSGGAVVLTATPTGTATFAGYNGACTGATCSASISSGSVTAVSAAFTAAVNVPPPVTLTVSASPMSRGSGTITSSPSGINCTVTNNSTSGACSVAFAANTVVTLMQAPGGASIFQGWSGDCVGNPCQITLSQARTAEVTYRVPAPGTVTVTGSGSGAGTVTSSPSGISCTVTAGVTSGTCSATFEMGTTVTLLSGGSNGGSFDGFSGACSGNTCTIPVTSGATSAVSAAFTAAAQRLTVSPAPGSAGSGVITSVPSAINCTVNNGSTSGVCSVTFAANTVVTLTQAPSGTSIFQGWSGDCVGNPCQITLSQSRTAEVAYRLPARGTVSVTGTGTGAGTVTSSPSGIACTVTAGVTSGVCSAPFEAGTSVTLLSGGSNGGSFDGFSGACSGGTCVLPITSGVTTAVSAAFTAAPQRVTVAPGSGSAGSGVITSVPAGISCVISGTTTSGTCTSYFVANSIVTLTQSPNGNAVFNGWAGDCTIEPCQLAMSQGRTALAIFKTQAVAISGAGTGNGVVTSAPSGISCVITAGVTSGTCATTFPPNAVVTLTSTASGLSSFSGYSGACAGTTCTVTLVTGVTTSVTAQFTAPPTLTLSAASGSEGGGTLTSNPTGLTCALSYVATSGSCSATFALNTSVTITQVANGGSVFVNWAGACSGSTTCTVALSQSKAVQALYRLAVPGAVTVMSGAGAGNGTVSSSPGGVACSIANGVRSGICRAIFPVGSSVTLIATAASGSTFTGFSGSCSGMTCVMTVPENGDISVTATFTK